GLASYQGNLRGLSETVRAGDLLVLVNRPQEAVAALQQLQQAYINYYTTANDYNRAQFRLFRALGYPAQRLACGDSLGAVIGASSSVSSRPRYALKKILQFRNSYFKTIFFFHQSPRRLSQRAVSRRVGKDAQRGIQLSIRIEQRLD